MDVSLSKDPDLVQESMNPNLRKMDLIRETLTIGQATNLA